MGDLKLCLLLLLSTSALTLAQDEDHPTCLLAQRYKTLHTYEYQYEAESLNAIDGASQLKNGPKASCKVKVEVPQTCSFVIRTTGCKLSEVVGTDADGNPEFAPASNSDAFAAEMEKHPLKVVVEREYEVKLYPEDGETTTILNFKRGIVSALAVPLLEEDKNKNMPTIHGKCKTYYTVNAREDIATNISLNRDLSRCEHFLPIRDHSSPLALITGMHYPLAQMLRSSQTCNYKFDNEKKHMTSGSCTENHILIPFSHKGKYGVTNVGKQALTLTQVSTHNDRVFDHGETAKDLQMEAVEDKSAVQDKDILLNLMRELFALPETEGERRPHLFHTVVSVARSMKAETLRAAIPEATGMCRALTFQILTQCGTPECSSAIMHILRTFDKYLPEVDAAVFALGFMSNPSALLINDMLEMAKQKPNRPIMYALSNVVKRFYKVEGKLIPEIHSVAEFMASQLGDCTGEKDQTFMTLRVVGNMAPAVVPASPALQNAVINCVKQPAASQEVQHAAIQVYRLIPVPDEAREVFMQVLLDSSNSVQERIAAYLVLMKNPQPSELTQLTKVLSGEEANQVKSFVISHINNILSSTEADTQELRQKIQDALQGNEIDSTIDPINFSRHYKIGSLEGNMIFEEVGYLPKEVMLELTLKAFGFEIDMLEIGIDGKGFEPTIEALFGEKGFFPDTALKTMYFVSENMPRSVTDILENIVPALKKSRMKRQTSKHLLKEIGHNLDKLVKQFQREKHPEAMVYLSLLGNELGYLETRDVEEMIHWVSTRIENLYMMFPGNIIKSLMTNPDTTIFAHYIFMDNEFFLPTVTGVPLRIALSGTFTPGFKGGLQIARDMSFSFMPSGGVEFVTQIGSHIPEYVNSGLEMHTNIFHESGIRAKLSVEKDQVKLTIPTPTKPTKLIKMTNTLVAITGTEVKTIPPLVMDKVDVSKCTPSFAGMKYCTALQYVNAFSHETNPYFPITGNSKFAVELHPTGEVTEYTVTAAYELKEGEDGQKVDSLKFILRAEGAEPTEARLVTKYNRGKNAFSADIQIPDYDVEAGLILGLDDGNAMSKGTHSISLDFINKNIPELSLVGRANLKAMKEGMLQIQVKVPSVKAESTVTANLKHDEDLELEIKNEIKIMDTTSEQKIEMKYDGSKIEVEVRSHMNTKTNSLPNGDFIDKYANDILDIQVGQTDMKVRHIFRKFVEAANNYMEKYGAEMLPYMKNFRLPDIPEIYLPETLFLNTMAKAVYHFNNEHFIVVIPLPLGGKSASELNFPPAINTPRFTLPKLGLEIESKEIRIPDFVFPKNVTLSIPLFGKAEFSTMMKSNLYEIEATLDAGKDVVEPPSYSAKFDLKGNSPIDILSVAVEGSGMVSMSDSIKAHLRSSLTHKFVEAKISIEEEGIINDKIQLKSVRKIETTSPFGLNITIEHTGMTGIDSDEFSGDSNIEGSIEVGPIYGKIISAQSFTIFPFRSEAKLDSRIQLDSTILKSQNTIVATVGNGEFLLASNTNAFEDVFTHSTELSFKDSKLRMTCDANVFALGTKIRNKAEASAGAGEVIFRMETNGDHFNNRLYSLMVASLDANGLSVNCNANMELLENRARHKTILTMNRGGLSTSGTTTLNGFLVLENTFDADIDTTRATLSVSNKAEMSNLKIDNANNLTVTLSSLDFQSKAKASANDYISYTQNIIFNLKPYTASANVDNHLELLAISFSNEAQFQAAPYKMDLTGNMKAAYDEEEIKHTYQINYADLSSVAKCSTTGKLFGTLMNHNTELEIVGFAAKFTNDVRFNSQPIRFDHKVRWSVVPFDFNLDAIFNGDGDMTMFGKHGGQFYGKFQLRAQPWAFASLHECRASTTQQLDNGFNLETMYDYKMDTVLLPQEQKTDLKIKSKMNEHALIQSIEVYNTEEKIGIELSGTILTNIVNTASTENQEFTISGFLKYDKSTDSHIIHFPLLESLPVFLDRIKGLVVYVAEAVQNIINNEDVRARLAAFPQEIGDLVAAIDLEDKLNQVKQTFIDFTQNVEVTVEDVEKFLNDLKMTIMKVLEDLRFYFENVDSVINDTIYGSTFYENFSQKIDEAAKAIDDIKPVVMHWLDSLIELIDRIDQEKLKGSSFQLLYEIEVQFKIKEKVQNIIKYAKEKLGSFDMTDFMKNVKELISFLKGLLKDLLKAFIHDIPRDLVRKMTECAKKLIHELDIAGKINYVYAKMKAVLVQLEADKNAQAVLEKAVDLIKQLKIEKMVQAIVQNVKEAEVPYFQCVVNYLKTTEIKNITEHLNGCIEILVQELKSLHYNDLVDYTNRIIAEYATFVNEIIRKFEIPKTLEVAREFINTVLSSIQGLVERLRDVKAADMIHSAKDIYEQVVCDSLKRFAEIIKKEIEKVDFKNIPDFCLEMVRFWYSVSVRVIEQFYDAVLNEVRKMLPDDKIIDEIEEIINAFLQVLRQQEVNTPSFTVPFTNLVVPSVNFNLNWFDYSSIPNNIDIPEFIILGRYTVPATTISFNNINEIIIKLIDLILNCEIEIFDVDAFFGDLTLNYLPSLPDITLPEFIFSEITFPTIPQLPVNQLVETLEIPKIKMPAIPTEIMVPCFGKLYGEIRLHTPIYTVKTSAEFQNSTQSRKIPLFTGSFSSEGTAPNLEIFNYKLDTSTRIAVPQLKRIVFAETVKFDHVALGADHQATVTLYGLSAQAQAKTTIKVNTEFYTANLMNTAFIAMEGGMTATVDTTYTHTASMPIINVPDEVKVTQKVMAQQDDFTFKLTAANMANGKCKDIDHTECYGINHQSNLQLSLIPRNGNLSFTGDTNLANLKMKHQITAEAVTLSYLKFNVRNQAEAPAITNSLLVASGLASINDLKIEMKANHETELYSAENGVSSNVFNFKICPDEFVLEFQNKANAKVNIFKDLNAKIELQNDYVVNLSPDGQKINRVFLARLNDYKMFYNFTLNNNRNDAGIFFQTEGQADLFFLKIPINIPEVELPFISFRTPAFNDLNLYEQTGLQNILTTTEQTLSVDAKILYQKSKAAPLVSLMDLIYIPSVGRLTTDLSFKSAIFNLNTNALLYADDGLIMRLGTNTASVFECLVAKVEGTTSLTTKRGLKLASSISLKNQHIEGTYDSTISMSTETFETAVSVASLGKIALPILNVEASQNLTANTKPNANALSTFKCKSDFNIPEINAAGKVEADHRLKLEVNSEHVSVESSVKSNVNVNAFENYLVLGVLDKEVNLYLTENDFRSTSKVTADAKLNYGSTKVIGVDLNNNMAAEASMGRLFAELRHSCNNEANLFNFKTKGKHNIKATIDLAPTSSLTADMEMDMAQQSNLGDLTYSEKTVAKVTISELKISSIAKFASPVYTTNMEAEMEGSTLVFKTKLKSSATSPFVILDYDLNAHSNTNFENDLGNTVSKLVLTHSDFTVDVKRVLVQALRQKRQSDESVPHETLNVDITSPTFTNVNLHYHAQRGGISASMSTPTAGFLGLQLHYRDPFQMSARFYGRNPTALETDVDILQVKTSKDADKTNLQIVYNMEAPKAIVSKFKTMLPSIISSFRAFADKYRITGSVELLKDSINKHIDEAYNVAVNYDAQMSQISIFFRNTIVRYQKTVQIFLDAVIKVLRETRFRLPWSDEMITLPELIKKLTDSFADVLDVTIQNMEVYYDYFFKKIGNIEVSLYDGDVITVRQITDDVKTIVKEIFDEVVEFWKDMESLDALLEETGETLEIIVEKTQEFIDSLKSDYLEAVFTDVNELYRKAVAAVRKFVDQIPVFSMEEFSGVYESIMNSIVQLIDQFNDGVSGYLQQTSEEVQARMTAKDGTLEINFPLDFQH